jgi:protein dithiol oxidoreductase (disulfide-forming)
MRKGKGTEMTDGRSTRSGRSVSSGNVSKAIESPRRKMVCGSLAALSWAGLGAPGLALAQPRVPAAGTEYRLIKPAQPTESGGRIEVIEFFWYGCPHCNSFEPALADWVKHLPADVAFRKVHVPFNEKRHQQLFFTLEAMGKAEELTPKVFAAIHVDRNRLDTADKMAEFLGKNGIDPKVFRETFDSFSVQTKVRKADTLAASFQVDSVPLVAINGKYLTSPSMAGSNGAALQVVEYLIGQERKSQK